jgi:hypothetical protein
VASWFTSRFRIGSRWQRCHHFDVRQKTTPAMFDLSVEELTWKIVGQWTTKETELDYSIIAKHQPMSRMDTMIGSSFSPYGKPYRVSIMYFLNGSQLFIATLRCDTEDKDFESKTMIDLSACALMTEPVIDRRSPGFLSTTNRASYWGEKFFYLNSSTSQTLQEEPPYRAAFTLRFPESNSYYEWEEAVKFSAAIKRRINRFNKQEGEQDVHGNTH